ncbi:MAG: acyl carrier protein [Bacteroidia bacterium]|nr:acyl carrier protein [Bacteroidia bacterium]
MKDKLKNILATSLEMDFVKVTEDISQENSENWDSIHHLIIISAIEEEFSVSVEPEEILEMTDFKSIYELLLKKTA